MKIYMVYHTDTYDHWGETYFLKKETAQKHLEKEKEEFRAIKDGIIKIDIAEIEVIET